MSPTLLVTLLFGVLGLLVFWLISWEMKRTYYRSVRSEERTASNEIEARDEAKNYRISRIKFWVIPYLVLCLLAYMVAFSLPTVKKVSAALYPSATPTQTSTRTPTVTPRATSTPLNTATLKPSNFLTQVSSGITPTRYSPPGSGYIPGSSSGSTSGGGSSVQYIPVTRIVNVVITRIVVQMQTVIIIVTPTFTPVFTETVSLTPTQTLLTPTVTATFTETPSPTSTETATPTPTP